MLRQSGEDRNESAGALPREAPRQALDRARAADRDELNVLVHDPNEAVLLTLIENPNLEERHVTHLLTRPDLSSNVLSAIAAGKKWTAGEAVRLGLAQHPRTPKRIALAMVRQLYVFDLARLNLLTSVPADIRRVAEEIILARVPHLPVGQKLTLARRGPSRVAGALLAEGHPQALKLALNNAFLTESQILKVLAKPGVPERAVAAIAQHPKWSAQYAVRVALLRNPHTPPPCLLAFLPHLKLGDLKEIAALQGLIPHARKYIQRELHRRQSGLRESD
ncbi:MAG TPA: hypothetical protein VKS44_08245 [Candidatus Acidoferrales bacterium]|nr:hypothetical protein [Candidatus Acidoferrales bacterium]